MKHEKSAKIYYPLSMNTNGRQSRKIGRVVVLRSGNSYNSYQQSKHSKIARRESIAVDWLRSIPTEILSYILKYILLSEVMKIVQTSKYIAQHCHTLYLPSINHFCLKQQNLQFQSFNYMIKYANEFKSLYMDGRGMLIRANNVKGFVSGLAKRLETGSLTSIRTLIIRSCQLVTNSIIFKVTQCCQHITTLGEHNSY